MRVCLFFHIKGSPFGGNGDDRRQRRKQGGAVGAAASRMQAAAQQTLGAATRHGRGAPERARMLTKNRERDDSIALTKGLLIAAQRLFRAGLALSVCCADTSPKGRGFGKSGHFLLDARGAIWRKKAGLAAEGSRFWTTHLVKLPLA